ncbi:MAG TPA: tetratricopeptide repeat protein [Xanthobacteraceae bacterium]|nr:tetratricopeptide repeat protein [Xanthobacteraceae bacterium]
MPRASEIRLTLADAVQRAHSAYAARRYDEAERLCQSILKTRADHFGALHLLGATQSQTSRHADAVATYDLALKLRPGHAEAHFNRGVSLQALKRYDEALASYDRAIELQPNYPEALTNRGVVLKELNRPEEALASYDRALSLRPNHVEALYNRGVALQQLKRYEEALAYFDLVVAIRPKAATAHNLRGVTLHQLNRMEQTLEAFDRAVDANPNYAAALNNRGNVLKKLKRFDDALESYNRALAVHPRFPEAYNNRALLFKDTRRYDEALADYARALELLPDYADAHWNEALTRLRIGDYERGWQKYEWRWEKDDFIGQKRNYPQPLWRGEDIRGKTILLYSEQGFGDTIQFCRYAPLVAARGARVILDVQKPLLRLMSSVAGVSQLIPSGRPPPDFDVYCPLMSLPLAFGTRVDTIPAKTPYLRVLPELRKEWQGRLVAKRRPLVGLAWSGNPAHRNDENRSMSLQTLLPLLETGATFVSLQKDVRPDDAAVLSAHPEIANFSNSLKDFAETAALIAQLDLVISVDTSIAHLAGALAKPVWVLLPYSADWRWLVDRDDSPWYPTARLFRQDETRSWDRVIQRVQIELRELASQMHAGLLTGTEAKRQMIAAYKANNLTNAERLALTILQAKPDHFDALHILAVVQSNSGRKQEALGNLEKATSVRPNHAEAHYNRGIVLKQLERHHEALAAFARAIELQADYADALYAYASTLQDLKRFEEAAAAYERVLALRPEHRQALNNRGNVLRMLFRYEEALASFDRLLALHPDDAMAHSNRGSTLADLGRYEEALKSHDRAISLQPESERAHNNRGITLMGLHRAEEALASYDRALALRPDFPEALNNRANTLRYLNRFEDAMAGYAQAIAARPDYAEAYNNRGVALLEQRRLTDALADIERAIALKPDYAQAHFNAAHCRLLTGDFERGWEENEWRWETAQVRKSKRNFAQPLWTGREEIAGKTILLHAEQGFGDTIQFCRYARLVKARGARVILQVERALKSLLSRMTGADLVLSGDDKLPDFDLHCPLMSLPRAFATRMPTIPSMTPPLSAPQELIQSWALKLGQKTMPRVGLAWSGRASHRNDHNRSIRLHALRGLLDLPVQLVSLQKEVRSEDERVLRTEAARIIHFGPQLTDFLQTAALASLMDVVVSVDTSVAHLAASIGRPTWIMLPYIPDWRWLLDREDSPWYPTVRLFRQDERRNWDSVVTRVCTELLEFISSRPGIEAQDISPMARAGMLSGR